MNYLGRFLVEQGRITEAQLEDGLRFQRERNQCIGQMAVERGLLSPEAVRAICRAQREDAGLFGDIAVREWRLSRRSLDELLFFQKVHHTYLGEALLLCGHIGQDQYQQLLGRHYALRDEGLVSLRYLNEFFCENKVLDNLVQALVRAVRRFADEPLTVAGIGTPFAVARYPVRALVEGKIDGGRPLAAVAGLSQALADRLEAGLARGELQGLKGYFKAVGHYFGDLLREDSLLLSGERIRLSRDIQADPRDCAFVRLSAPSGEAGLVLWLSEAGA
jgi:hypothetical protein